MHARGAPARYGTAQHGEIGTAQQSKKEKKNKNLVDPTAVQPFINFAYLLRSTMIDCESWEAASRPGQDDRASQEDHRYGGC